MRVCRLLASPWPHLTHQQFALGSATYQAPPINQKGKWTQLHYTQEFSIDPTLTLGPPKCLDPKKNPLGPRQPNQLSFSLIIWHSAMWRLQILLWVVTFPGDPNFSLHHVESTNERWGQLVGKSKALHSCYNMRFVFVISIIKLCIVKYFRIFKDAILQGM